MGLNYRLEFTPSAAKSLRHIDRKDAARIHGALTLLAVDPRPPGSTKLHGRDAHRVRVGNYRIIYQIKDDVLLITVVKIGHRRDVYR